ncbi:MAG TPA: hypothetical protein VLL54_20145 [Pyrinomonadaceae bacterium]|nr:hypothetical protein [Pyrinomonadaceae bacterium]
MLTRLSILLCMLCAIVLVGCSKTETNTNTASSGNANKPATAPATTAPATASAEKVGVPECDTYLANYESCVSGKIPEVARAQYKTALEQTRSSWRKLAENPTTKGTLAAACKQAATQAEAAMKSYGCTF